MGYIKYDSIRRPKHKIKKIKNLWHCAFHKLIKSPSEVLFKAAARRNECTLTPVTTKHPWLYVLWAALLVSTTSQMKCLTFSDFRPPTQQLKYRTSSAATNANVAFHFSFSGREKIKRRQNFHWYLLMFWKGSVHTRHYHQETGRLAPMFKNKRCLTFHRPFTPFSYIYSMDYIGCILLSVWCTVGYFKCAT